MSESASKSASTAHVNQPAAPRLRVLPEQLPSALHQPGDDRAGQGRAGPARRAEHGPCARPWPRLIRPRPAAAYRRMSMVISGGSLREDGWRGAADTEGWSAVPDLRSGYPA
jgi:hypothetical protein